MLSHPRPQIRDTQYYAGKFKVATSKRVALRNLVQQELGVTIQGGEHSSVRLQKKLHTHLFIDKNGLQVTDARATMAVYRIHRKEWEKGNRPILPPSERTNKKRKRSQEAEEGEDEDESEDEVIDAKKLSKFPGGGRKGVSSGLSTVTKRTGLKAGGTKAKWWKELGAIGSKGSVKLSNK